MKCTKCLEEKTKDNFAKYFHSTQNAWRQRSVCRECFNQQKKVYRELMKELKNKPVVDPNLRECSQCKQLKSPEDYYERNKVRCKQCILDNDNRRRRLQYEQKGGSDRVPIKPNTYADEIQKQQTFQLMLSFGYTYNEENGIWYKEPWKTRDGKFPLLGKTVKRRRNIPKGQKRKRVKRTPEDKQKVYDMIDAGASQGKVHKELDIPKITIYKWLKERNTLK